MRKRVQFILLFVMDYQTMTLGWQKALYFRTYARELGSKSSDFVKQKLEELP